VYRRGLIGYLPANLVQGVVGLVSIMTFTRLLSPDDYGRYALGFSAMAVAHNLVFTWLEAAMARFWPAEDAAGRAGPLFATLYRAFARVAVGFVPVCVIGLWLLPAGRELKGVLAAGLAIVVVRSLVRLAQERRRAAGDVAAASTLDMVQTGGGFLIGATLAALGMGGAAPLLGLGIAALACLPFALPGELARGRGGRADPALLRTCAAYGLPVSLSLILSLGLASADRFLIGALLDPKSVGAYHAAYSLANRTLDVIFLWLGGAGVPALVMALERGGQGALKAQARTQASAMLLLALPATLGLMLVARPLAEVMVGEGLRTAAAAVTPLIAVGAFFSGVTTYYFHQAFTLGRRTRRLLWAMAIPAAANIGLNLFLLPRLGLVGAAWAAAISYGLGALASAVLGRGAQPLPVPWATLGKGVAACALMVPAVLAVPAVGGLIELTAKAGAGALAYGTGVLLLDIAGARTRTLRLFKSFRLRLAA
jgi:O-antigen/teichoic acid export membrane protein